MWNGNLREVMVPLGILVDDFHTCCDIIISKPVWNEDPKFFEENPIKASKKTMDGDKV